MVENRKFILTIFIALIVILAACGNSNDEVSTKSETELSDTNSSDSNDTETNDRNDQAEISNNEPSKEEDSSTTNTNTNTSESRKEEYLQILNDTKKESDEMEAEDSSTYAMKKVENDRYDVWDDLLNEIYGVLNEQLSTEEMEQLRNEQRNWIEYRDNTSKEASLKYEGGTQEQLEYVAVLANLTEKRCYELVEDYMM